MKSSSAADKFTVFKPWNPRTWTPIHLILGIVLLHSIILYPHVREVFHFYNNNNNYDKTSTLIDSLNDNQSDETHQQKTHDNEKFISWTPTTSLLIISLVCSIKLKSLINQRYENHQIFNKGNVPSVQNKNPITGNALEMLKPDDNCKIHRKYHEILGETYGIFYGPDPWILTTDLDLIHKVFTKENNRTQYRLPFVKEFNKSLGQIQSSEWKSQRRTLDPFFTSHQMKKDNVFEDIENSCSKILDSIKAHPAEYDTKTSKSYRIVNVSNLTKKFSMDVIFKIVYGYHDGVDMSPFAKNDMIDLADKAQYQINSPIVRICVCLDYIHRAIGRLAQFTSLGECIRLIDGIMDKSLTERRLIRNSIGKNERKMIDTVIECMDENKMNYESFRSNLFFLFVAGFETTANTLIYLFWSLATHQDVQDELRESIIIEGENSKFLTWVLQESMRLHSAVPAGIGRTLSEDLDWKGMKFFKGTTINASIYSIHRDKKYWGEDAEVFRPKRFDGLILHPAQYLVFGHGPRHCLGVNLAMAELRAITIQIVTNYRVEKCSRTPDNFRSISPNIVHVIIQDEIELKFVELNNH